MTAPDPILEALGDIHARAHRKYPTTWLAAACWEQGFRTALADVRPLIEAEVREQVAREIETRREQSLWGAPAAYSSGLARAARIARGVDHA